MENSGNAGKVFGALLLGAAIGGTLGILFAPEKGSKLREKISDEGSDMAEQMEEKFNQFLKGFKKEVEHVRETVNDYAHDVKSKRA